MVVSPLVVARSQLLTAIDLFFNDRDPISVHALADNAREILESLCKLAAVEPITELLSRDHPGKPKKDFYAAINLYRNCFKRVGKTGKKGNANRQSSINSTTARMNTCFMFALRTTSGSEVHLRFPCRFYTLGFVLSMLIYLPPLIHGENFLICSPGFCS